MKLVYATSKKIFVNYEILESRFNSNQPLIAVLWHGRIMMASCITKNIHNKKDRHNFVVLASRHKDGMLVSRIMSKFGFVNVSGSSASKDNKAGRGITMASIREILKSIKSGMNFAITPDGPRGPKYKIKGQVINIAKISGAPILPFSYSASRNVIFKSWDQFMLPLPFSKLCYYFEDLILVDKDASEEEMEKIKLQVEDKINSAMKKADEIANS
jgi:hypothetical protein